MKNILLNSIKLLLLCTCLYALTTICNMQCSFAKNKLYYYEPETTEIEGTIITKTVKGYCDVLNDGFEKDTKEVCPFLILDKPIDVRVPPSDSPKTAPDPQRDKPEKNIKILQISNVSPSGYNFKNGEHVRIQGVLFRHFRNCDHTRVLIDLEIAEKLDH